MGYIYRIHDLLTRSAHLVVIPNRSGQTIVDLEWSRSSSDIKHTAIINA